MLVVRLRENSTPELVSDNIQFVWLTMWVSAHLVKRNIIHTASQHMYGEGTLLKGIVIKQMSDGILLLMLS